MIIASTLFLVVGIVTFVIGVFTTSDLTLIVVSIGASLLAALTLTVGVLRDRKQVATDGFAIDAPSTPSYEQTSEAAVVAKLDGDDAPTATMDVEPDTDVVAPITLIEPEEPVESPSVRAARSSAAKAKKSAAKKAAPKKTAAKKTAAKKSAAKKASAKKPAAKKPAAKKPAAKKSSAKKSAAKKPAAKKKAAPKKTAAKKPAAKKTSPKKPAAKKTSAKPSSESSGDES